MTLGKSTPLQTKSCFFFVAFPFWQNTFYCRCHWLIILEGHLILFCLRQKTEKKLFERKAWCSSTHTTPITYKFDNVLNFIIWNHFCCHNEFVPLFFICQTSFFCKLNNIPALYNRVACYDTCLLYTSDAADE